MKHKMKILLSGVIFLFGDICAHVYKGYDPLLVVVIMVKNEEAVMRDTLQPFVDGGVDSFFIFDTGSEDRTIEVTQEFFDENNIEHAYIEQEPFIDFGTSRNRALDLAQARFPHAAFMLMIDAEWYITGTRELLNFCQLCIDRNEYYPSYMIHVVSSGLDMYACRLIRCNCGVRFAGPVHETIIQQTNINIPDTVYCEYLPTQRGYDKTAARFKRDRELLWKEHLEKPWCTRTLFYLARVCEDLGDLEVAYDLYKKRAAMVGWPEEDFNTHLYLGRTIASLVAKGEDYQWAEALTYFLKAYQMRPHRAEPLILISRYYVESNQMATAFLFALPAAEMEYPKNDILFVQKHLYDYYRYEMLARCAWYIGEFEVGEWAARQGYEARPGYDLAKYNLDCYLWKKSL